MKKEVPHFQSPYLDPESSASKALPVEVLVPYIAVADAFSRMDSYIQQSRTLTPEERRIEMHIIGAGLFRVANGVPELSGLCSLDELKVAQQVFLNILAHESADPALKYEVRGYAEQIANADYIHQRDLVEV